MTIYLSLALFYSFLLLLIKNKNVVLNNLSKIPNLFFVQSLLTHPIVRRSLLFNVIDKITLTQNIYDSRKDKEYIFHTTHYHTYKRAITFFKKEPETLDWIDNFNNTDIFYDIGANIGLYTVYAAVNNKAKQVYAFEPESLNYADLNKNISINEISEKVLGFNIALSDRNISDKLYVHDLHPGGSMTNFGETTDYIQRSNRKFKQGCLSFTLDAFIKKYKLPFPNHIKIDVDGLELKILKGAINTLATNQLQTIQIEIYENHDDTKEMFEILNNAGLSLRYKKRSDQMVGTDFYNMVFEKTHTIN